MLPRSPLRALRLAGWKCTSPDIQAATLGSLIPSRSAAAWIIGTRQRGIPLEIQFCTVVGGQSSFRAVPRVPPNDLMIFLAVSASIDLDIPDVIPKAHRLVKRFVRFRLYTAFYGRV